jgi:hypothetical protein
MNLCGLTELIRKIQELEPERRIILFGSSSLLASFPDLEPASIGVELTIDADVFLDPDSAPARNALQVELGEGGAYHSKKGFFCDFVDARADQWFPPGWKERCVRFPKVDCAYAMHPVDAAAAKLVATAHARVDRRLGRRPIDRGSKDTRTVLALIRAGCLTLETVISRSRTIDLEPAYLAELAAVEGEIRRLIEE